METPLLQRVLAQALMTMDAHKENNMSLGLGSLTSELDRKETAFQSLPQSELMKKRKLAPTGGLPASLTDALIAEKVLNDKAAAANSMAASMQGDPRTVVQQNEADIETQTQQEVLKATAGVLQNRANKIKSAQAKRAMQQGMGITRAPVQRRQVMAQGGIVGYAPGGPVIRGLTPEERERANTGSFDLLNYIRENPLGALGYGLLGATSLNPLRAGAGALFKGAQKLGGTKVGQKVSSGFKDLFMTPKPGVPKNLKKPDLNYQMPKVGKRKFKPGAVAGAAGIGALIGDKLLNPNTPVEETPDSIEAPVTQRSEAPTSTGGGKERDLSRLIYLLRGGTGRDYDQQEFTNKIQKDTLIAKQELNKINSANVLQNRLTQVNAEIAALQAQLSDTPTNRELAKAEEELAEDRGDSAKQERVNLLRIASAAELERYADPMGSGDVGLLVQRKELQARVNQIQKSLTNDPMDAIVARNT